ncbi:hypothetical protein ONZ43_g1678 [Nemania bipapillata]|uniref:Uncharacterized protein n=1 Tax=Nemania bipapillata TaxID=110536 RepID=A0ACC2J3X4_9PEZI|nr:hypothetical protein ONZ43_g1678 [Nemania bipapillata]
MPRNNRKKLGDNPFCLGARLTIVGTILTIGLLSVFLVFAATQNSIVNATSYVVKPHEEAELYYSIHDLHKKEGPYNYGNNAPFTNATSDSATLTVTITSTSVTIETVIPLASLANSTTETPEIATSSGSTTMPTPTAIATPFGTLGTLGTLHAHTVTDFYNSTVVSFTAEGQTNSVTINSILNKTATSSTFKCTEMPMSHEQPSSYQASASTTIPKVTVTTNTLLYSTTDSEEYTSTETVTMTPYVTIVKSTTLTPSSTTETLPTRSPATQADASLPVVTVTVYMSQPTTEAQTGAVGISISTATITVSELITATVMQTVSPVPVGASTKTCTESTSAMGSSPAVVLVSQPITTVATALLELTITTSYSGDLVSTMDASSDSTTTETISAMTTITYGVEATSTSMDTTCTTSSSAVSVFTTVTIPSVAHAPYPVSNAMSWSVSFINSTRTVTVSSGYIVPSPHHTDVPVSSGGKSTKKPSSSFSWGGNDGAGSHFCVVMLVAIVSLVLLVM